MDNELVIIGAFLGTGLVAYVIIPGLLVMWDRVLDHMEDTETTGTRECHTDGKEEGEPPLTGCCGKSTGAQRYPWIPVHRPDPRERNNFRKKCRDFRKRPSVNAGKIKAACPEHNLSFIKVSPHVQITGYNPRFYNSGHKYPDFPHTISKPFNQDLTNFTLTTKSFNSLCVALHFEYSRVKARREEAKW